MDSPEQGHGRLFYRCSPSPKEDACAYTDYVFATHKHIIPKDRHKQQYHIDIDGDSFSGSYQEFFLPNSLLVKTTLFKEWQGST
jgi:hypothetical protein